MLKLSEEIKLYVLSKPVDMRKSIDGLTFLVTDMMTVSPQSNSLFIFYNKAKDKVKAIYWHKNGFVLLYKRLESGRFKIKCSLEQTYAEINSHQLDWLLAGLDYELMQQFPDLNYACYA